MTNKIVTANKINQAQEDFGNTSGAIFFLAQGVTLFNSSNTSAVRGSGDLKTYYVNGSIGATGNGITAEGDQANVVVSQSGSIAAEAFGMRLGQTVGSPVGSVSGVSNAGFIAGVDAGIGVTIGTATIVNTGVIMQTGSRGFPLGDGAGAIIAYFAQTNLIVFNSGTIAGTSIDSDAGLLPAGAIRLEKGRGSTLELDNTGEIFGVISLDTGADRISNAGNMTGDIFAGGGVDSIENSGTIQGIVRLEEGNDVFRGLGDGITTGPVNGGAGADSISGGEKADWFQGAAGNESLFGAGGNDTLDGGTNADTIFGGAGDDSILGREGFDVLQGGTGDDTVVGGDASDTVRGGAGDDSLRGGEGNDRIEGGNGNDTLVGGTGADTMNGCAGDDVFVFESAGQMGNSTATRDVILRFEDGADVIDLSGLGPLTFSTSGAAGIGTPSVWFTSVGGGADTLLRLDTTANGNQDKSILLKGIDVSLLGADDLILA